MSWTGNVPPRRMKVTTEYVDGKLVRRSMASQDGGGGSNFTEARCTCAFPAVGCTMHFKMAEEA